MTFSFVSTSPTSAGVIGACWYLDPHRFLERSDDFSTKLFGDITLDKRFVAMKNLPNSLHTGSESFGSIWLEGEGAFLDVSAYSLACSTMTDTHPLYLIFNDTLFTRHPWRLISKRLAGIRDSIASFVDPAAAGELHPSTDLLLVDSKNPTRRHLSTFCFLLNNAGFRLFKRLLHTLPASGELEGTDIWIKEMVRAFPSLRALLHVHLFGPSTPWTWKGANAQLIQRKAVTVIFEYLFTVELLGAGIAMPINHGFGYRLLSKLGHYG